MSALLTRRGGRKTVPLSRYPTRREIGELTPSLASLSTTPWTLQKWSEALEVPRTGRGKVT